MQREFFFRRSLEPKPSQVRHHCIAGTHGGLLRAILGEPAEPLDELGIQTVIVDQCILGSEHSAIDVLLGFVVPRICGTPAVSKGARRSQICAIKFVTRSYAAGYIGTFIGGIIRVTYMFADKDTPMERVTYKHYVA